MPVHMRFRVSHEGHAKEDLIQPSTILNIFNVYKDRLQDPEKPPSLGPQHTLPLPHVSRP